MSQKQEPYFYETGGLVTKYGSAFCLWLVVLYFKGMPDSINFDK